MTDRAHPTPGHPHAQAHPGLQARPQPTPRTAPGGVGGLLRHWRGKRRLSQLDLALTAGVSSRHLSFVETGRSRPSPELLLAIAQVLDVPLRERNEWLLAAGYAPRFPQTPLDAPALAQVTQALHRVLDAHDPYPGVALDGQWNLVIANRAAQRLIGTVPAALSTPTPNIFRIGLHPQGLAACTSNFGDWGRYMVDTLDRLAADSADEALHALRTEVRSYPNVRAMMAQAPATTRDTASTLLVPCEMMIGGQALSLFTTLARIGTPRDVTLAELTLELFYPADAPTEAALRAMAGPADSA